MSKSNASQLSFRPLPDSGVVDLLVEHAEESGVLHLEMRREELDALAWAVWFCYPACREGDKDALEALNERLLFLRREALTRPHGKKIVAARLSYPRQGAMIGTENNEVIAERLNKAAEPLNEELRKVGGA